MWAVSCDLVENILLQTSQLKDDLHAWSCTCSFSHLAAVKQTPHSSHLCSAIPEYRWFLVLPFAAVFLPFEGTFTLKWSTTWCRSSPASCNALEQMAQRYNATVTSHCLCIFIMCGSNLYTWGNFAVHKLHWYGFCGIFMQARVFGFVVLLFLRLTLITEAVFRIGGTLEASVKSWVPSSSNTSCFISTMPSIVS